MTEPKIPLDVLKNVKTIVTHAHCPDGLASAILLSDALPEAEIIFATHDQLATLPATEGMLFCDISPPTSRLDEFLRVRAVVLDHHKSAKATVGAFEEYKLGVFADERDAPGVSGAVLAFRHVWCKIMSEIYPRKFSCEVAEADFFATRIGVRDTFHKSSRYWDDAWDLSAALMFRPATEWLAIGNPFRHGFWEEELDLGRLVNSHNRRKAEQARDEGFRYVTSKGTTVLIVQGLESTTLLGDMNVADLVVGFAYRTVLKTNEGRFQISMRSQGKVDVGVIAEEYRGGGHTNAAGFTLLWVPIMNPITVIEQILDEAGV